MFSLVQLFFFSLVFKPLGTLFYNRVATTPTNFWELFVSMASGKFHIAVLTYFLIAMISYAIQFYRHYREEQERRARMETRLAQAQLNALKMQLQPHFLFNTLNAITALIHSDPDTADRITARLGELLRITLENEGVHEVRVSKELEFTEKYLDIQRARFQDRLAVNIDAPADISNALVPNLILQPLVENAIRHGVSEQTGPGRIDIRIKKTGDQLQIEVADNGPGLPETTARQKGSGVGLANTRDRLAQLYGETQQLDLQSRSEGGVCVRIAIPYHTQPVQDRIT